MRWTAAAGILAAFLAAAPEAFAEEECFALFADPAVAPIEPGEPAVLFTAQGAQALNEFVVQLFDARGSELPIAIETDPSHRSFFLRSATRIEPGEYFVEYSHECNGTTRMPLAFEASPPKPPDAPEPGDEKKGCDCRAVSRASQSTDGPLWLVAVAVAVAVRRRWTRV